MTTEIHVRFIVETQGNKENDVKNVLKKHVEQMKMMKEIDVYDVKWEPTEEVDGMFSALADVGIKTKNFEAFFAALMGFAPTAVIFESTDKVEIEIRELQNITNDIMQLFHLMAQQNLKLKLKLNALQSK